MKNKIHTVIFDLDGTLADSAILTVEAFKQVMPNFGLPILDADTIKTAIGHANPGFYYMLYPDYPREAVYAAGQQVEEAELKALPLVSDKILFPDCRELLAQLKAKGIKINIASTGDHDHVYGILTAAGILDMFDAVSCGCPDKVEMLRDMTDDDKTGYIMVGDMNKDYDAARANGIMSVGALYGYCRKDDLGFDMYISSPLELLDILGGLYENL